MGALISNDLKAGRSDKPPQDEKGEFGIVFYKCAPNALLGVCAATITDHDEIKHIIGAIIRRMVTDEGRYADAATEFVILVTLGDYSLAIMRKNTEQDRVSPLVQAFKDTHSNLKEPPLVHVMSGKITADESMEVTASFDAPRLLEHVASDLWGASLFDQYISPPATKRTEK